MKEVKVIGIGDNVCDHYEHLRTMFPGGQALNFTVYASMLGAKSAYLGVFGTDAVAAHVMQTLDELGIDRSHCRQYEGENGWAKVALENGDRVFLGSNRGGVLKEHPIRLTDADIDYLRGFSWLHTSNNSYFEEELPRAKQAGIPISYDFSGRWNEAERAAKVAPFADIVFLSCGSVSEEETQDICRNLLHQGICRMIATRGSKGAVYFDGKAFLWQAPELVEPVDTIGAGDSFATAFLVSMLRMSPEQGGICWEDQAALKKALSEAASFSAKTCLVQGAFGYGKAY